MSDELTEATWRAMGWKREELGEQWWMSPTGHDTCHLPDLTLTAMLEWAAAQSLDVVLSYFGMTDAAPVWHVELTGPEWCVMRAGDTPGEAFARALVAAAEGGGAK